MKLTDIILPIILLAFGFACVFSKKVTADSFTDGARDGIKTAFSLIPTLVLFITAISMLRASGLTDIITSLLSPVLSKAGIPSELVPLLVVRPMSGSGSTALLSELLSEYGADSFVGRLASVISASSDTVFYVTALYMSGAGVKSSRYTLPLAFAVMILGIFLSAAVTRLFF